MYIIYLHQEYNHGKINMIQLQFNIALGPHTCRNIRIRCPDAHLLHRPTRSHAKESTRLAPFSPSRRPTLTSSSSMPTNPLL